MPRPSVAVVLVATGLLLPSAAAASAAATPSQSALVAAARAEVATSPGLGVLPTDITPAAKSSDPCALRVRWVSRLERRLAGTRTTRGKQRTVRLLNARKRSLARCRAHAEKRPLAPAPPARPDPAAPAPAAPGDPAAPAPAPAPSAVPPPGATPTPAAALTVNGVAGGAFAASQTLDAVASGLAAPVSGGVYRISVRVPERPPRPTGCRRQADGDAFGAPGGRTTFAVGDGQPWCAGVGRVILWSGPASASYGDDGTETVLAVPLTITG